MLEPPSRTMTDCRSSPMFQSSIIPMRIPLYGWNGMDDGMGWNGMDGMGWNGIPSIGKKEHYFIGWGWGGAETDGDGLTDHRAPRTDQ
jgi:hypothetical protein